MKRLKKLLLLALSCLTLFTVGAIAACDDEANNDGDVIPTEYVYKVRTQSEGGFGLKNVNVSLYDGEEKVASVNTNAKGDAYFLDEHVSTTDNYTIALSNVPNGWSVKDETIIYQTSDVYGSSVNINFSAALITDEAKPDGTLYKLGDVVYDFAVTDCEGDTYQLSEILSTKKMVMLNLWASWCGPCKTEFPPMQQAYQQYQSSVEILAVSIDSGDTQNAVDDFKASLSLTFPMVGSPASSSVANDFYDGGGVPVTYIIDRYGVVSYHHGGNMVAVSDFTSLFDKFVGDNYVQTVIDSNESNGGNEGGVIENAKPNIPNPDLEDVEKAFSAAGTNFKYSFDTEDEYAWPWVVGDEDGASHIAASNVTVDRSYSILNIDFTATANQVLAFDYTANTEADADFLYVLIDGTIIHSISGIHSGWNTCYAYVFEDTDVGEHTLSLIYIKDSSISGNPPDMPDDDVRLRNLRFVDKATVVAQENLELNILRHAAEDWNNPADFKEGDEKTKKYNRYVNVKLSAADGYYHVIPENAAADYVVDVTKDPILYANMMNSSRWNKYDVWQLAYNEMLVYKGMDLEEITEDFAWAANESSNGYVPVTPTLKTLLDVIVRLDNVIGQAKDETDSATRVNYFDEKAHIGYYEEEWLELCLYFQHYGKTPVGDSTRGITYEGAIEIFEGENTVNIFKSMVPVGIKHKFTPTKSGVYHFYSTFSVDYFGKSEVYNPYMWLVDSDKKTFLAESDDFLIHHTGNPENFDVKYYLEEGKTYYCIFSFFLNATGKFDMEIDYLGNYYENFTNCAIGPYTMNMITYKVFLPNTQNILYDKKSGYYRVANEDDVFLGDIYKGLDDKVYLDLINPTMMFPYYTLKSYIETYVHYEDPKTRLFYLPDENGDMKDYSAIMYDYWYDARENDHELYGKIAVNQEIMHILLELTKKHDGFGGVKNSWQMLCYYYQPIGQQQA